MHSSVITTLHPPIFLFTPNNFDKCTPMPIYTVTSLGARIAFDMVDYTILLTQRLVWNRWHPDLTRTKHGFTNTLMTFRCASHVN